MMHPDQRPYTPLDYEAARTLAVVAGREPPSQFIRADGDEVQDLKLRGLVRIYGDDAELTNRGHAALRRFRKHNGLTRHK